VTYISVKKDIRGTQIAMIISYIANSHCGGKEHDYVDNIIGYKNEETMTISPYSVCVCVCLSVAFISIQISIPFSDSRITAMYSPSVVVCCAS